MKKIVLSIILLCFSYYYNYAQVGIGTTTPNASSILDIESTTQGVLVPRLTTAQITAIGNPATGLLVFNSDEKEFQFNFGTTITPDWSKVSHSSSVKYSNTNTSTNINTGSSTNIPIFGAINWNDDTSKYTVSGNTITINDAGRYRITVNISYRVPTIGGNSDQRVSVEAQLAVNGTLTGTIATTGYVRHAGGHREASLHLTEVLNITSGQTISVRTIRGGNSAPAVFRSASTSNIYIEKIK